MMIYQQFFQTEDGSGSRFWIDRVKDGTRDNVHTYYQFTIAEDLMGRYVVVNADRKELERLHIAIMNELGMTKEQILEIVRRVEESGQAEEARSASM